MGFEINTLFREGLPPVATRFSGYPKYNFVGGHNDNDGIPVDDFIAAITRSLKDEGKNLATYGLLSGFQGYLPLREHIAERLGRTAGMKDRAENVLMTSGSLQALELVNDLLLSPGDVVIAEEACYVGSLGRFARAGVTCRGVRMDENGMDMDHLADILSEQKVAGNPVKFIYTIPTVQNPTATVLPLERRKRMLELATQYDCAILEDDCYADLLWEGERPPAIRALDDATGGEGRVIYCGSFSKTLAPALRVGYIMADWPVQSQMLSLKTDSGSPALEQLMLAEYCPAHFDAHVSKMKNVLREKCDTMISALEENFGASAEFAKPKGGIFIWIKLPEKVNTTQLAEAAAKEGIALNPGAIWTTNAEENLNRFRICFGHPDHDTIREGVARLADICHQEFGVPQRSSNTTR
jgi:2-aminoadipate transaminase